MRGGGGMSGKNSGFSLQVQPPSYVLHPNFPLSLFAYWKAQAVLGLVLVLIGIFVPVKADDGVICPNLGDLISEFSDYFEVRCLGFTDQRGKKTRNSGFKFGEGYSAKFTFTLKESSSDQLTIEYQTTNSTDPTDPQAMSGLDYEHKSGALIFAAGQTASMSFDIPISEDSHYEVTEYFGLKITFKVNDDNKGHQTKDIEIYEKEEATITITDSSDNKPSSIEIPETAGNNNKEVKFKLDKTVPHDFTINWELYDSEHRTATLATNHGGNMVGVDIVEAELKGSVTFPANTRTQTVSLGGIQDDSISEPDEQFALNFRASVGTNNKPILFGALRESELSSTTATRSFTIKDNDLVTGSKSAIVYLHGDAPIQYLSGIGKIFPSTRTVITEGRSTTITATLKGTAPTQNLTIPLKWTGFPSTADSKDFDLPAAITISSGQRSGTATLTIRKDNVDERHYELLAIEIDKDSLDSNYERGDRNRFEVIMVDANKTPVKLRNLSNSEIEENSDAKLTFEIEMSRPPNGPVDNAENAPFTVVLDEGQPSFRLKYTPVNPAMGGKPKDFMAPDNVAGSECAEEGGSTKQYVCTVTIDPRDDDLWENDETFKIDLDFGTSTFNDGLKAADGHKPLQFTIKDDETQPKFSIEAATATEGGVLVFKVKRTGATGNEISVQARTKDDTGANHAVAGKDYTAIVPTTLEFRKVDTVKNVKNFSVTSLQDIIDEENETFLVTLTAPKALDGLPAPAIEIGEATGTINDDNAAPNAITITVDTDTSTQGDQDEVGENDRDVSINVTAEITSPTLIFYRPDDRDFCRRRLKRLLD